MRTADLIIEVYGLMEEEGMSLREACRHVAAQRQVSVDVLYRTAKMLGL